MQNARLSAATQAHRLCFPEGNEQSHQSTMDLVKLLLSADVAALELLMVPQAWLKPQLNLHLLFTTALDMLE